MLSDFLHKLFGHILGIEFGQEHERRRRLLRNALILNCNENSTSLSPIDPQQPISSLEFLPFLSSFNQEIKPFASSYCNPKYHVSLNPIVRHTRSNKSLPVDLHCGKRFVRVCKVTYVEYLSVLYSNCRTLCIVESLTETLRRIRIFSLAISRG